MSDDDDFGDDDALYGDGDVDVIEGDEDMLEDDTAYQSAVYTEGNVHVIIDGDINE